MTAVPDHERQIELCRLAQGGDEKARAALVQAVMPFVWRMAKRMAAYCRLLEAEDLANEGAIGVLRAIDLFQTKKNVKFLTYAALWMKASMGRARNGTDYEMPCSPLLEEHVRNGRAMREWEALAAEGLSVVEIRLRFRARYRLQPQTIAALERRLFRGRISSLDAPQRSNQQDVEMTLHDLLPGLSVRQDDAIQRDQRVAAVRWALERAGLSHREREIVKHRLMADGRDRLKLQELGDRFGVTRERIRQLEVLIRPKLREAFVRVGLVEA